MESNTKSAVEAEKKRRLGLEVMKKERNTYELYNSASHVKLSMTLWFYDLERLPACRDTLYFSDLDFNYIRQGMDTLQYSATIGNSCAREPHDFLIKPNEFLILQYADGETIILEEQYG